MGGRNLRVGDSERETAIKLLGEHMSAGRLEIAEYDERCVRATGARYRAELDALFADLPAPAPPRPEPPTPLRPRSPFPLGVIVLVVVAALITRQYLLLLLVLAPVLFLAVRRR